MLRLHVQTGPKAQQAITLVGVLAKGVDRRAEGEVEGFVEDEKEEEQKQNKTILVVQPMKSGLGWQTHPLKQT